MLNRLFRSVLATEDQKVDLMPGLCLSLRVNALDRARKLKLLAVSTYHAVLLGGEGV